MTSYSDELLRHVLTTVRTIAVVGASPNPARPSHRVAVYLARSGYRVFAVNPGHDGSTIAGLPAFGRLADIPHPIDMVDVFRSSRHLAGVVEEALALSPRPKVIWSQLGVVNEGAAARAEADGVTMIMDRCPAIERPRLL
ncbi:CoA-binding protein [Hansschlegelia sp. KR7-227]|uniref:CoA-binding protein n=1 Tax=Hansschlegelia sp. KR7-227 TaxID=3400914 RepID=UPI003C0BA95F